jgi:hypothetical protein
MVIEIKCEEMVRVYAEMERIYSPHNMSVLLGLKLLKYEWGKDILAITNQQKFFLMAMKYGIQYTFLD